MFEYVDGDEVTVDGRLHVAFGGRLHMVPAGAADGDEETEETEEAEPDAIEVLETRGRDLNAEIQELAAIDTLDDTQSERWGVITGEFDEVRSQITTLRGERVEADRREEVRSRAAEWALSHPEEVIPGDVAPTTEQRSRSAAATGGERRTARHDIDSPFVRFHNLNPRMNPREFRDEVRGMAMEAIEHRVPSYVTDEMRSTAYGHVERDDSGFVGEHMLATGSDEYRQQFTDYIRTSQIGPSLLREGETRASLAEGNTGALLIPFYLDPTIILTNAGAINPFRSLARVETITTNTWHGVTSAGVTAEWTAESAQVADASPTLAQPGITPVRADAHVQLTMEQIADSNITDQLAGLMADAKDRLEATAFAVGTGSTQPKGVVTAVGAVTASRVASVTTAAYGAVDVFNLDNGLNPRYRMNASWVAEWAVYNATRQFSVGTGALTGAFWVTLGGGQPPELLGRPAYVSSAMTSSVVTSAAQALILGDFKQGFVIVDRIGMSVLTNPYVVGANGRPIGETGFTAFWRVGSDCVNVDAFRLLQLK